MPIFWCCEQYPDLTVADPLKEGLFLASESASPTAGDLFPGDAAGDQLRDDIVVSRITPGSRCTPRSQKIIWELLVAAVRVQIAATFSNEPIDLRTWEVRCGRGKHPGVDGELAAVRGDVQRVVYPWVHFLGTAAVS